MAESTADFLTGIFQKVVSRATDHVIEDRFGPDEKSRQYLTDPDTGDVLRAGTTQAVTAPAVVVSAPANNTLLYIGIGGAVLVVLLFALRR